MDVLFGNKSKKLLRAAEYLIRWKLKADIKVVDHDMQCCQHSVFKALYKIVQAAGNNINPPWQKRTIKDLGGLGVWILYKDTAYRDVTIWMLYQMLKRADVLLPEIEKYYKEPKDMYPNVWYASRLKSKDMKKKGEIAGYEMCLEEEIFTPSSQKEKLKKL